MQQIDLNLLAQLSVLLQTRSVTQAAARLGISQPAMSRSLAELRRLLGDPLLVRTRGGMLLTRRAEELIRPLQEWLAQVNGLVAPEAVDPAGLNRRFRIIAGDHALRSVIGPALPALLTAAPEAAVDIVAEAGDVRERLAAGEADIAIGSPRPERHLIHDRLLRREEHVCLLRRGHPLAAEAASRELFLADFLCWPHVAIAADPKDEPLSRPLPTGTLERRVVATLPSLGAAAALVGGTDAILFVPASAAPHSAQAGLVALAAPPELGLHEQWAFWHNRTHRDPAVRWLIDLFADHCQLPPAAANDLGVWPYTLIAAE